MQRTRFYGLVGAGAFALVSGTVVAVLVIADRPEPIVDGGNDPAPPDIRDAVQGGAGALAGKDLIVQMMDKEDPTRQSGELRAALIDPMPTPGHYAVDRPQIWMFLDSGKTLFVRADSGQLVMPSRRQEPESGVLRGGVEIRIYDTIGVGDESTLGAPSIVARMPVLTFDTTVPEMESPQPFTVAGRGVRFEGKSLRVLASQTRERVELVEVLGGGTLTYTQATTERRARLPTSARPGEGSTLDGAGADRWSGRVRTVAFQPDGAESASPAKPPNIVNYLTTFVEGVTVTQADRILEGDRLDVWARLVDGRLPDDAIGGSSPSAGKPRNEAKPETENGSGSRHAAARTEGSPLQPTAPSPTAQGSPAPPEAPEETVRLTWSGPMVARPVSLDARELETDHVHLRVTAETRGVVTMEDNATGASGRCNVLEYGATTQDLALAASGVATATLQMPGQGRITASRIEQNLGSGIGHVPGAGLIEALSAEPGAANDPSRPMARWSDSATFLFATADGRMTDRIKEATLIGDVTASSKGSSLSGETVHAYFDVSSDDEAGSPSLARVRADGSVQTGDAKGNTLEAGVLDVAFSSPTEGGEPDPTLATAIGSVRVKSASGDEVTAAFLEAELGRDERGELGARVVRAEEWVEVRTAAGQHAVTPTLVADVPRQVIDLIGEGSLASQSKDGLRTEVTGDAIRLFGLSRAIEVASAGTFRHGPVERAGDAPHRTIDARWTTSMRFSDEKGTLDAMGDVHAVSHAGTLERQEIDADIVAARIMPASEHERLVQDAKAGGLPVPERPLLFAEARADPHLAGGGNESRVQASTYAPTDPADAGRSSPNPAISRLFQAQGAVITADNEKGIVEIPGPGRFVVVDLREEGDQGESAGQGPGSMRGRTLFEWSGTMRYDRLPGVVRLSDRALMVQRRLDGNVINVNADELEARVTQAGETGSGVSLMTSDSAMELTGVSARRNVVVTERTGSPLTLVREIQAEVLDYDTARGTAEATSPEGGLVTLFETARGVPVSARSIFWDLANDRIEIRGMTSITAPR